MYCSNCGAANQTAGAYCRKCGQWLADAKSTRGRSPNTPGDKMTTMAVFSGINSLMALASTIVLYATYLGRPDAQWSIYVAAAFSLVIAIHQMINFFFALELKKKFGRRRNPGMVEGYGIVLNRETESNLEASGRQQAITEGAGAHAVLLGSMETGELIEAPSVTENTTELLDAVPQPTSLNKNPRLSNRS